MRFLRMRILAQSERHSEELTGRGLWPQVWVSERWRPVASAVWEVDGVGRGSASVGVSGSITVVPMNSVRVKKSEQFPLEPGKLGQETRVATWLTWFLRWRWHTAKPSNN